MLLNGLIIILIPFLGTSLGSADFIVKTEEHSKSCKNFCSDLHRE